jgi:hypothetical protein
MFCRASPQIVHFVPEGFSASIGAVAGVGDALTVSSAVRWPHDVHVVNLDEPRGISGMKNSVKNLFDVICVCEQVTPQCEQVLVMWPVM